MRCKWKVEAFGQIALTTEEPGTAKLNIHCLIMAAVPVIKIY